MDPLLRLRRLHRLGLEHVVASPVPPAGGSQGTGQDLSVGDRVPVRLVSRVS